MMTTIDSRIPFLSEANMSAHKMTIETRRRSFIRDRSGIAAVEFGLIAPVLLIMLIGVVEVTRAVSIDRRFGQVTSMVADLISREEDGVSTTDLEGDENGAGIYGIVEHIMGVWGTDTLKLNIYPVRATNVDRNDIKIYVGPNARPSFGTTATKTICTAYTGLTTNLLDLGGSAIVVEGEYGYTPLLAQGILSAQTWKDRAVLAPRNGCVWFGGTSDNCQPATCTWN